MMTVFISPSILEQAKINTARLKKQEGVGGLLLGAALTERKSDPRRFAEAAFSRSLIKIKIFKFE